MAIKKRNDDELIDELLNPISDIIQETQYKVLSIITSRINSISKLSATDAHQLNQLIKQQDLAEIESIIAKTTDRSVKEVDSIIVQAAQNNDDLAKSMYEYRNMPPSSFKTDLSLLNVVNQAKKSMVDDVVNLSKTTGFVFNGKMTDTAKVYNYAVNKAIFEVQQGYFDYNTVMRSTITQLASSGLRTVDYESGYSRRLDSSVRMAVSDGVRGLNVAYRDVQGQQFGADGIELSAHAMSEPIHGLYQGKQFTKKEFEQLQGRLERPFFTMNCRHSSFPIIMGLSKQAYSDEELDQYENNARKPVQYSTLQKDKDGNPIKNTLSKYDASQVLRKTETDIRRLKDIKNQLSLNEDNIGIAEYNRKIKAKTAYYKRISEEVGLEPQLDRLRVYTPK